MSNRREAARLAQVALSGKCPRCGKGNLFTGFLRVAKSCSFCQISFVGHDTGDGPAFFIMLPLCIITAILALVLDIKVRPPVWLHILVWPSFILGAVILSLRPVKALMIALQYRHRDLESVDKVNQQ